MSQQTGVLVAVVIGVLLLAVWASRGDKVNSAARLGISDADHQLAKRARAFGLLLDTHADTVTTRGQAAGRFTGSHATIQTQGALTRRFTVTRLATLGFVGLGTQKKIDNRELYITIEGDGFQLVVKVAATFGALARQFAAAYNTRSGAMATPETPTGSGTADELERLAKLHADGALDESEFAAAKARLLGTPAPAAQPQDQRPL